MLTKSGFVSRLGRGVSLYLYCNYCACGGQVACFVKRLVEIFFWYICGGQNCSLGLRLEFQETFRGTLEFRDVSVGPTRWTTCLRLCDWHGNGASAWLISSLLSKDKVAEVAWKMWMFFVDTLTNVSVTNCTASNDGMMKWLLSV